MLLLLALLTQSSFDLVPVPALRAVAGSVELRRVPSPFSVAVTRDGNQLHDVVLTLHALPDPSTLGPYRTYIAWVTTPRFDDDVKLGPVRNGVNELGRVALEKFLILVTAEAGPDVPRRGGRLVLRGMSPANLMLPLDVSDLPPAPRSAHAHDAGDWPPPSMHPAVPTMPAGLDALRPRATPFLPLQDAARDSVPWVRAREVITLADGDSLALEAGLVRRRVAGREIVMYAFNGQQPGPLVRVTRGTTIVVRFTNRLAQPSSVHWHGVRLDNRSDGVPHVTQDPVPPGGSYRYVVRFPDAGIYWYHPHVREDIQQDLGLYGNLFVRGYPDGELGPVHREEFVMLDDFLVGTQGPVPFGLEHATHALMGRFGNVLLVNGEPVPGYRLDVRQGEVVRFYITNASNTRTFNVSFEGLRVKVVGTDVGPFERDEWVESVVIAPAERYIVEARFATAGAVTMTNRVRGINRIAGTFFGEVDTLSVVTVGDAAVAADHAAAFSRLQARPRLTAEITAARRRARADTLALDVTLRADSLPFGLIQAMRLDTAFVNPVEWSGTMPMMDWLSTTLDVHWLFVDRATGRRNMDIAWQFQRGDVRVIRLTNDRHTLHPMAHPIHIHGQRFLVLSVDGIPNDNLAWKDTFLLPVGATADILLEVTNPGRWMLHCHIAEHLEAGMHFVFDVR